MPPRRPSRSPSTRDLDRARLAAIVDSSDDAIVSKTLQGIITSWNRGAERIFGFGAAEAVGTSITLIIPSERLAEETEVLARVSRGERVEHFETVRRHKDGSMVHISLSVSPILDSRGRIIGASKIARDITERRRADAEREMLLAREQAARDDAEKANRIKDEFLATLSHELRTPLNALLGWVRLLRMGRTDPAETDKALETIERNTRLLHQLVEDVLDVSRITTGTLRLDPRPVALIPVIEAAVESMRPAARAKNLEIELLLDAAVPPALGDSARIQQMVWNLVSNAIKFTEQGHVEVHLTRAGARGRIRVTDTGKGIAPGFLPYVFDRFTQADSSTTRAHGGLGLGLAIVRHLAELHGGSVHAESAREGGGATFLLELPLTLEPITAPYATPPQGPDLHGLTVLVVDDDPDAREILSQSLEGYGATVLTAARVDEALAMFDRRRPHVVLCDIALPARDGFDFLRTAYATGGGAVPVIAITALAGDRDRERLLGAGFRGHLSKPVDPLDVARTVARLTGRQ